MEHKRFVWFVCHDVAHNISGAPLGGEPVSPITFLLCAVQRRVVNMAGERIGPAINTRQPNVATVLFVHLIPNATLLPQPLLEGMPRAALNLQAKPREVTTFQIRIEKCCIPWLFFPSGRKPQSFHSDAELSHD